MNGQQAKELFRGPMVSVATPFKDDYSLDIAALKRNIRYMIDHGVRAGRGTLLVAAAGGEFPMLSNDERKAVMAASVEAAAGEVAIAASIQLIPTHEVVELANYAHSVGVQLGQLSAPYYYPPTAGDVYQLFKTVSEESELPIMVYANWWVTPAMDAEMCERLAALPNVVALKWSASNIGEYSRGLAQFADRLALIDNQGPFVWGHMLGTVGFITHQSNFWPEYPGRIWDLLEAKRYEEVIALEKRFHWPWLKWIGKVCAETEGEGPFIKAAMEEVGLVAGPPRPPAMPVSEALRAELRELMRSAGTPRVA
ncbi:MAG: dihydrodipicolinate synthase family protein [Chloroflexi bacterium]|nr:dihydrodipicolinate synthase family protein [Chloroflexota bacterium]